MRVNFLSFVLVCGLLFHSNFSMAEEAERTSFSLVDRVNNVDALTLEAGIAVLYDYEFDILYQRNNRIGSPDLYAMLLLNSIRIDNKLLYSGYQVSIGYTLWHRYVDVLLGVRMDRPAFYDAVGFGPELLINKTFLKTQFSIGIKLGTSFFRNQSSEFNSSDTSMFYDMSFTLGYRLGR